MNFRPPARKSGSQWVFSIVRDRFDGVPAVDPRLHDAIAACLPAQLAHQNATLTPSPMNNERSRLQGKARKAIDIVTLSRLWKHASSNAPETIQSVAGPSTGLLWSDCSRDERSGWMQDHHRLSLPRLTPGSICALAPQTGARKGQLCGMPLDSFGRHSHGARRAAGAQTLVNHAIREEVAIFELHEKAHDGTVKEARMDVVLSRPGGLERWMIDVRTVDGKSATAIALGGTEGAFRSAEQEKQSRYKGHAQVPSVELRGGIASTGLGLLEQLSWEAAIAMPSNGCGLELVLAFEAEALCTVHRDPWHGLGPLPAQSA